jgi:AcrR family transcriptional regulator
MRSAAAQRTASPKSSIQARLAQSGILQAGLEVFAKKGFAATRVEDILEAADVARRTFYKHFGNKEDVLAAIYELATGELLEAMRSFQRSADPLLAVRAALDMYLEYHVINARMVGVLVQQAIRSDSPLAPLRQRFRDEVIASLDQAVQASTGEKNDPMFYAALLSALEGVSLDLLASGASPGEVERAKDAMHRLLDRALTPRAS